MKVNHDIMMTKVSDYLLENPRQEIVRMNNCSVNIILYILIIETILVKEIEHGDAVSYSRILASIKMWFGIRSQKLPGWESLFDKVFMDMSTISESGLRHALNIMIQLDIINKLGHNPFVR